MAAKAKNRDYAIRAPRADAVFHAVVLLFLALVTIVILFPVLNIIATSFSSYNAVIAGRVWIWPAEFQLETYKAVFSSGSIFLGYRNTILYTVLGTCVNLAVTICAAYPLSFSDLRGKNALSGFFAFTMLFSGGMVPGYIVVNRLGLIDTIWAMLLPGALSVWNMIIMRTYFSTQIPRELKEASQLDGCGELRYLWQIVLPLSVPILMVVGLYYAVGIWNSYFDAMIYMTTRSKMPLSVFLRDILILNDSSDMTAAMDPDALVSLQERQNVMKYALIMVSSVPMFLLYPFVQRYFIKGVMIGSVKG